MTRHLHAIEHWRLERLFTRGGGPGQLRAAQRSAARCPECAARYRHLWRAEAALCGDPEAPSPFALDRVEAAVLARCAPPADQADRARWTWAAGAAALAAVAALALFVRGPSEREPVGPSARLHPVALAARGAPGASHPEVGIRLFRVAEGSDQVRESRSLRLSDVFTATYTNAHLGRGYAAIFGVQQDGRLRWYYPAEPAGGGIALREDVVDEPLGDGIRLSVRHGAGWLRVSALFSASPLDPGEVERAVTDLARRPGALSGLEPLSLPSAVEHSMLLEIAP